MKEMLKKAGVEFLPALVGFYIYDTKKSRDILIDFCNQNNYEYLARVLKTKKQIHEMCLRTEKYEGESLIWVFM